MAAITSLVLGTLALSGAFSKKQAAPKPMAMPQAPKATDVQGQAQAAARSKRTAASRTKSIYTSPLGIGGEADIVKKQLLGQ